MVLLETAASRGFLRGKTGLGFDAGGRLWRRLSLEIQQRLTPPARTPVYLRNHRIDAALAKDKNKFSNRSRRVSIVEEAEFLASTNALGTMPVLCNCPFEQPSVCVLQDGGKLVEGLH